jgi:hypothetical protein
MHSQFELVDEVLQILHCFILYGSHCRRMCRKGDLTKVGRKESKNNSVSRQEDVGREFEGICRYTRFDGRKLRAKLADGLALRGYPHPPRRAAKLGRKWCRPS